MSRLQVSTVSGQMFTDGVSIRVWGVLPELHVLEFYPERFYIKQSGMGPPKSAFNSPPKWLIKSGPHFKTVGFETIFPGLGDG